ncbi:MAG: right-handed parallel beta-helix repeat-containing protein [Candidatus Thermoplasmatota archaeon]|nr:right-handed parallel beta-helix repeat-containing protein [Candidatus Thermoplasmatota archaeon]
MELVGPSHMGGRSQRSTRAFVIVALLLMSITPLGPATADSRTTTVWSGTVLLPEGHTVESGDVLTVSPGTTIKLGAGYTIDVDGRISVEGTSTSPVLLDSVAGNHEGLVFNYSSNGLGSKIDNLTITNSKYGLTIYGSDPVVSNLTVLNADNVAVDLFSSASPTIRDLVIDGGGQDVHGTSTTWRYGIGLSIGAYSAPVVEGANIDGLITRGLNQWGSSGGLLSDLNISNISGSTLAIGAGIWIEDSFPLISDSSINRCDNGIYVRHITQGWTTRPTIEGTVVENSMYRGVMVEQYNHSQYSNLPLNAVFNDLEVRGTGGPGAKAQGLAVAAFDINTSGVHIDGALIEDNAAVGIRGYMIDSSTIMNHVTLLRNGKTTAISPFNDKAGLFLRSANWAPTINDLVVKNSTGPGVLLWKGGVQGSYWEIEGNGANGVDIREFHPDLFLVLSKNNTGHGVSIRDSSNVELEQVHTYRNGLGAISGSLGSGIYFHESNDVTSSGKNVSCDTCSSTEDQFGLVVRNSVDLQLSAIEIRDPVNGPALDIDNSGLTHEGNILVNDIAINSNSTTAAVEIESADAAIEYMDLNGDNEGISWSAAGDYPSFLNFSVIRGGQNHCLEIYNHPELIVSNVSMACPGPAPAVTDSIVNFTDSNFFSGSGMADTFHVVENSHVRWISSSQMGTPTSSQSSNIVDVMWRAEVSVVNQNHRNIPFADVNITFDNYNPEHLDTLPYSGREVLGPFVGQRWTPLQGWSANNTAYTGCDYDGVHNDSNPVVMVSDFSVECLLEIPNQPPFIIWDSPEEGGIYASGSAVVLNATRSWDLDDDPLSFSWTSSIDGDIVASCLGGSSQTNNSWLSVNDPLYSNEGCLSDGTHQITLQVCDSEGHCSTESRQIELTNLPPVMSVGTSPSISSWGTLYLGKTANVTISLAGTYDPEGDELTCWVETSYEGGNGTPPDPSPGCPDQIIRSFPGAPNQFSVTVYASDSINPAVSWIFDVELFNELPTANMVVTRSGNTSSDSVLIDGSLTFDPEGDDIKFEFWSDRDGLLHSGVSPAIGIEWTGTLSKGEHTITMYASDVLPGHSGQWTIDEEDLHVSNSPPVAVIASPQDGILTDSGTMVQFQAVGSGDWDLACETLPENGSGLVCNPFASISSDLVSVLWESDIMSEPLGSGWSIEAMLPEGVHQVTLTVDDGSSPPVSDEIMVRVDESAPILILDSPVPDAVVLSNLPILFDFRQSFDPDGDDFTVSVFSDLLPEPILESKTTDFWYNDYLPAGLHNLTFQLTDNQGMVRTHIQQITVLETGPVAIISGISEGQYIPPGGEITLDGSESYDYDGDITLYQWMIDGSVVGDKETISINLIPGPVKIELMVRDSRGEQSYASINLTVGSSSPQLNDLNVVPGVLIDGEATPMRITVELVDPDGTTSSVGGEMLAGGISKGFQMRDDGLLGDTVANDGIWTYETIWEVSGSSSARIEAWALDGDSVSPVMVFIVPVTSEESTSFLDWMLGSGLPFLFAAITIVVIWGMFYSANRRRMLQDDLDMIESWSAFDSRELEEETENRQLTTQDPKE